MLIWLKCWHSRTQTTAQKPFLQNFVSKLFLAKKVFIELVPDSRHFRGSCTARLVRTQVCPVCRDTFGPAEWPRSWRHPGWGSWGPGTRGPGTTWKIYTPSFFWASGVPRCWKWWTIGVLINLEMNSCILSVDLTGDQCYKTFF